MSSNELQEMFNSIFSDQNNLSDGEKEIILKLMDSTIKFRDELVRNTGEALSVEETKMALNIYMNAVNTGRIPANIEKKIGSLIKLWFEEINGIKF